jgi:hypothetical protein
MIMNIKSLQILHGFGFWLYQVEAYELVGLWHKRTLRSGREANSGKPWSKCPFVRKFRAYY